ncbi:MAG TPA: ribosome-associated translation inhibitor RaiA [Anaerolineae bacterium]|nr:ribosome-associated translation inhibitor RaiA [Anaerolineae bacterium]
MVKAYDFDVSLTCRSNEYDKQFKETAINQMLKLSKYHTNIIDGDITIDKQNSAYKIEVSVRVPGHTVTAVHQDYNQIKALDMAIEKIKKQLKKLKSKVADHRVTPQQPIIE